MNCSNKFAAGVVLWGLWLFASPSWAAQQGPEGRAHYLRYCGACHGMDGKGDGTVSRSLKLKPVDLTQIQARNKGVFPSDKVMATIDGRARIGAHGDSKMPVWGEIFEKQAAGEKDRAAASAAKVIAITEYLETIQR
jgi:mono/diheme cytochrome c family protein